ncbi:cobalamin biosynthesis protein [Panacagrimonas sp.]|uniref:cobalamin biosynthesis protein n=1 Tax=Panacagrimonas sp. TaxID=2480088 RepID=UPI003B528F88
MTLIVILLALLAERLLGHVPGWGSPRLLGGYLRSLQRVIPLHALWRGALAIPLVLVPLVGVTWWIQQHLQQPMLQMLFSGGVLFLCLGPRDLADDVKQWLAARQAQDHAQALRLGRLLQQGPGRYREDDTPDSRGLLGALFIQSHERLFGVLLWFFAFGLAGAVFYRVISRLPRLLGQHEETPASNAADTLHALAAWASARVTAALFGLAGSLDDAIKEYRNLSHQPSHGWRSQTWAVLAEVASGSIEFETKEGNTEVPATLELAAREVLNLQFRALMILLAFVAVFTTGDWLS